MGVTLDPFETAHPADELAWYRATTLAERLAAGGSPGDIEAEAQEEERARFRLQSWKAQAPFGTASYFEQRLALDGLTAVQLWRMLLESSEAVRKRFPEPPGWLLDLAAALSRPCGFTSLDLLPDRLKGKATVGFLHAAAPLIDQALARFDQGVAAITTRFPLVPFDPATVKRVLFATLPGALFEMLSRTMVLELNIARLEGRLDGTSPEERFSRFVESLSRPERVRFFLRDYPVLARLLVEHAQRWVAVSLEFLERLCVDWPGISAAFAADVAPGLLIDVAGNLADTHRGGRSVSVARFGSGLRVVYKPKSLAVDAHFQELLQWLNARGADPPFRTLSVLDRGTHGWVEHVAARACGSAEDVRRFYERQGGYLALLYALDATDFHRDNLVASGDHPFLVDLEALFHPRRARVSATRVAENANTSAHSIARLAISYSVLHIGLLPKRVWGTSENEGIDLSGLATVDGQLTPHGIPDWEEPGTDSMRLVRKRKLISAAENRPELAGAPVNVLDYRDAILDGFASTYALLRAHRDELLSDDGPLAPFAQDEVCVFLRSSRRYRRLLRESFHPDVLRDALDRDRLFDLLWAEVEDDRDLAKVIRAEREDLLQGDIPQFTTRPASRDLRTSSGARVPGFFGESSLSSVRRRVEQLGDEDFERQAWFVRAALSTVPGDEACWPTYHVTPSESVATAARLRAAAQAVGDRLEALAVRGEADASWIGLALKRDRFWSIVPFGMDVYNGLPGAALFLAYLGAVTRQERYTGLSQAALAALQRQIEERRSSVTWIGAFDGWGGLMYVLTHLGVLWDRPELVAEATTVVDQLPALIEQDEVLDLVGGAAGCIGALRCLHRYAPSDRLTATAVQCGDHLLARAQKMEEGIGWLPKHAGHRALAGFAHGAAGIAWSLLLLHGWTGLQRFGKAAGEAMAYERSLFVEEAGNWSDLRERGAPSGGSSRGQPGFMTAWCHGAVGIGLARLSALPFADDPTVRREIAVALETTLQRGFGHNHSLCHGDLGNLELLLQASRVLGDPEWEAHVRRLTATLLGSIERHGWLCGVPFGVETPGLMTGLAGIGYELLRLAEPELVPSVLVLEPPRPPAGAGPPPDGNALAS